MHTAQHAASDDPLARVWVWHDRDVMNWKLVAQQHWALTTDVEDHGLEGREHDVTVVQSTVHETGDKCPAHRTAETTWWIVSVTVHWNTTTRHGWCELSSSSHCRYRHWDLSPTGLDAWCPVWPWHRYLKCDGDDGQMITKCTPSWVRSAAVSCCSSTATHHLYSLTCCLAERWHRTADTTHTSGCRRRTDDSVDYVSGSVTQYRLYTVQKNNGPRTEPWRTPNAMLSYGDWDPECCCPVT